MLKRTRIKQLEAENERLRAELERVEEEYALATMTATIVPQENTHNSVSTVVGLEEMVLVVDTDDSIGYVNKSMAKLLGMKDRKSARGQPIGNWDSGPLGERTIRSIVKSARSVDGMVEFEKTFPSFPRDLLPQPDLPRGAGDTILLVGAVAEDGRTQVVIQDVTRTRWLEATFARYVSPKVIEQMQRIKAGELLDMERRELSILFCDLRGFTTLCQEATPELVRETVNGYLSNMIACIDAVDGTVQGFLGDEVMAIFGAPLRQEDHAVRALVCGVEMQRVHREWLERREAEQKPAPTMGVGIATGLVIVGNIGTESRMEYTAQGHGVNLAARLCEVAEGGEVLTVSDTKRCALRRMRDYIGDVPVPEIDFRKKGEFHFKNVKKPVDVLSVKVVA